MKSLLSSIVLWFLFLFNGVVAAGAGFSLLQSRGTQVLDLETQGRRTPTPA